MSLPEESFKFYLLVSAVWRNWESCRALLVPTSTVFADVLRVFVNASSGWKALGVWRLRIIAQWRQCYLCGICDLRKIYWDWTSLVFHPWTRVSFIEGTQFSLPDDPDRSFFRNKTDKLEAGVDNIVVYRALCPYSLIRRCCVRQRSLGTNQMVRVGLAMITASEICVRCRQRTERTVGDLIILVQSTMLVKGWGLRTYLMSRLC